MEHRECPNCGNDLLITEQRCAYCGSANPYYETPEQKAVVPAPAGSGTVYNGTLAPAHSSSTAKQQAVVPSPTGSGTVYNGTLTPAPAAVDPAYATKYGTKTGTAKESGAVAVICAILMALWIGIKCFGKAFWFIFKWTAKIFWFIIKGLFIGIAAILKIIF